MFSFLDNYAPMDHDVKGTLPNAFEIIRMNTCRDYGKGVKIYSPTYNLYDINCP